jgi:hypothetical protein
LAFQAGFSMNVNTLLGLGLLVAAIAAVLWYYRPR